MTLARGGGGGGGVLTLLLVLLCRCSAFTPIHRSDNRFSSSLNAVASTTATTTSRTPPEQVIVLKDADAVGKRVSEIVVECAKAAIAERGFFSIAIPGGSILKMLSGTSSGEEEEAWTSKTTLAYVNHKCVDMNDEQLATHAKAKKLFLKDWTGVNVLVLDGTDNGPVEAESYQAKLMALSNDVLPRDANGLPVFDLALIGVGDDGHVGSLYPNRDEVLVDGPWVLSVDMKSPPSITLSLPVMANAKKVVVAACGVSDKYPQGKSDAMRRAVADTDETLVSFPAIGLRKTATWIMDQAAASKLGEAYTSSSKVL